MYSTDVIVLGGLTITVEFSVAPAEPDVGIMSDYVDEWYITHVAGRPVRKHANYEWLYKRIANHKNAEDNMCAELMTYARDVEANTYED